MPVYVSMLRGVNVGGHNKILMAELRDLYSALKFEDPRTYVQSGNVIFRTKEADEATLANKIQSAIGKKFGFRPEVMLRSTSEIRKVIAANPFAKRANLEPSKLHVNFLHAKPSAEVSEKIAAIKASPEELHLLGRELYIYFPDGAGRSKLIPVLDRVLKTSATGRNWNSVTKTLEIAAQLEE
jgi:uncharacterized protein (DUF1697 family)